MINSKQITKVKKILTKYFVKDYIEVDRKLGIVSCPLGSVVFDPDGNIVFTLDFTYVFRENNTFETIDNIILPMIIIKDCINESIDIEMAAGHFTIFDEDGIHSGILPVESIYEYAKEHEVDFDIAKNILSQQLILESEEEKNLKN